MMSAPASLREHHRWLVAAAEKVYWALVEAPAVQRVEVPPVEAMYWRGEYPPVCVWLTTPHVLLWEIPLYQALEATTTDLQEAYDRVLWGYA